VKEIVRVPDVTRIPKAPAYIEGVANLRGSILPIVNLRDRFDMPEEERTDDTRAVVVEVGGHLAGLVVDQVSEVLRVHTDCIEPPPPVVCAAVNSAHLRGVAKLNDGKRLVVLLDVDAVLPTPEIEATIAETSRGTASDVELRARRQAVESEQVVTFKVDNEEYALALADVQEIIRVPEMSRVPQAPDFVEGVASLRNRLLPIVNLRTRFGMQSIAVDDDSRVVVVNLTSVIVGVQVDAVLEVLSVPRDSVESPPQILSSGEAGQLRGVAKLDEGRRLIMLLDAARVLSSAEATALSEMEGGEQVSSSAGDRARGQVIDEEQFVSFRIANEEFGVGIQQVQEIIWLTDITRVPRAPLYVEGIINLRGNVLPVIDMRKRFGLPPTVVTESTSILVVDVDGHKTGIIVDTVSEVVRLSRDAIEPPPAVVGTISPSFFKGVGKLDGGKRMLIILDLDSVMAIEQGLIAA
jgi:purine-binding chemotaxis protein CheW